MPESTYRNLLIREDLSQPRLQAAICLREGVYETAHCFQKPGNRRHAPVVRNFGLIEVQRHRQGL